MKKKKNRERASADIPFLPPQWPADARERRLIKNLKPHPRNSHVHPPEQLAAMAEGIKEFGVYKVSVLVDEHDVMIAGHGFVESCKLAGVEEVPVTVARGWSEKKKLACLEADNRFPELATYNQLRMENLQQLRALDFPLQALGWSLPTLDAYLKAPTAPALADTRSLAERFGIVPFSVFNAREGWWQDRKRAWIALGIMSEVGRGENLLEFSDAARLDGRVYKERAAERRGKNAAK